MQWEKRPIPDIDQLSTETVLILEKGTGFSGGYLFSDESMMEPDFRKSLSMDSAVIYETTDDWLTRRSVFQGSGQIKALFRAGPEVCIAQNNRSTQGRLSERSHFLRWANGEWKEVSHLDQEYVKVWGSNGPWFLAAWHDGGPNLSVSLAVSSDAALTWKSADLGGYNPNATAYEPSQFLTPDGFLFKTTRTALERFDLRKIDGTGRWEKIRDLPVNFNPLAIAGWDKAMWIFGSLPDKKFGLVDAGDRSGSVKACRGVPQDFLLTAFNIEEGLFHLVGALETKSGTETTGFNNMILRSENKGESWHDTELPIKGSLKGFDFSTDGRIWATAAGNRMQVLLPRP